MSQYTYIVAAPNKQPSDYADKIFFWPAHVGTFSTFGSAKTYKRRVTAKIRCRSTGFEVTSGGHPVKWANGLTLRRATPERIAAVEQIDQEIAALHEKRRAALYQAWKDGELVHASECANYAEQKARADGKVPGE